MIDIQHETIVPLNKAKFPHGNPSVPTRWRWNKKGVRGCKLETITVGTRVFTSVEAIQRFVEGTTAAAAGQPVPVRSPAKRERDIARAERELAAAGI